MVSLPQERTVGFVGVAIIKSKKGILPKIGFLKQLKQFL